ncbi:MAG: alanine dehydrogenase [Cytophagales bacterium]|nr:alanine dehydrogenase [Cytophagales bacterium]
MKKGSGFKELAKESQYLTKEAPLRVRKKDQKLCVGVPKERSLQENRVSLTPQATSVLVSNGIEVKVETQAGATAHYSDQDYADAGAQIVYSAKEAFESDIVIKVEPPSLEEIGYLPTKAGLISAVNPNDKTPEYIKQLNAKKITSIGYEYLEDKAGGMPAVRALSEIAGSCVMLIAAEYLSSSNDGKGVIMGGITGVPPTKAVILGAGTVAEYAARAALGLGVDIKIFDNHLYKLRRIKQALGQQVYTSTFDTTTLSNALASADVVIGAMRPEKGRSICIVTDEMVANMKKGSVIIDVSIDQGGCIETAELTTHDNPTYVKHGVIHYCVPNIASRVARTASMALSNIFSPILVQIYESGGVDEMIYQYKWFMKGIYTYKGTLTSKHLARRLQMDFKEIELLLAARL